ncbi:MAG: choice-of-anchor B family protein [Acidobacteriota bacterium]|nr:choice-of-anchor B family protein [Acidobacteriota bacterium]
MSRPTNQRFATITLVVLVAIFLSASVNAQATIKLLGQLDPFDGDNRYADVWGEGNFAYLGSFSGTGVMIFDISTPSAPRLVGHYNPSEGGRFQDVMVINGIGYFSSESRGGVHIVDVRNPVSPVLLSQVTPDKNGFPNVHELFVADGVLYEADSRTTVVKVFDVRDPRNPVFVRDIQTTDTRFIHAIVAVNGRLFTSGWSGKTDIYDVRNVLTAAPTLLGSLDSGTSSHASWPSNDGKLLASARETTNGDVRLFDISNPASPVQLATITAQSLSLDSFSAHNPYIIGNLLIVSWYQAGLVVLDISDPRQPKLLGSYDTFPNSTSGFDGCWGVYPFLGLDKVLLSDLDGGLFVVDATAAQAGPRTVSAASFGFSAIAAKSIVAGFGTNLASATLAASTSLLPTSLGGASVAVMDFKGVERLSPLFFVSPNQINFQIPAETAAGPALLKFTNGAQAVTGSTIVAPSAISIFTTNASGSGEAAALDAFNFSRPPFNATQSNGQPNIIAVFCTGLGEDATDIDANVAATVLVTIDDQPVTVSYAGRAPGFSGLNQLNIVFPAGITAGIHKFNVARNGVTSNSVTIAVR